MPEMLDWRPAAPPTVAEVRRWSAEHGKAFRSEVTESLVDGNDVAVWWAARVLSMLDAIEVLIAALDRGQEGPAEGSDNS